MPDYLKEKNVEFSLKSLEVFEDFSIMANYANRQEEILDGSGRKLEFPIREGSIVDKAGKSWTTEEIRLMPIFIFKNRFPKLAKSTRYLREVFVSGVDFYYAMPQTVNTKLMELIKSATSMGKDPLKLIFKQAFDEKKAPAYKYSLEISGEVGVNVGAVQQETPAPATASISLGALKKPAVDDSKDRLLKALLALPDKVTEEDFAAVCVDNKITEPDKIAMLWCQYEEQYGK